MVVGVLALWLFLAVCVFVVFPDHTYFLDQLQQTNDHNHISLVSQWHEEEETHEETDT